MNPRNLYLFIFSFIEFCLLSLNIRYDFLEYFAMAAGEGYFHNVDFYNEAQIHDSYFFPSEIVKSLKYAKYNVELSIDL